MSIDTTLLQVMRKRKRYKQLFRGLESRAHDERTMVIIKDFGKFFDEVPECEEIPVLKEFRTWFYNVAHPKLNTPEHRAVYDRVLSVASKDPDPALDAMLFHKMSEGSLAVALGDIVDAYSEGKEIDLVAAVRGHIQDIDQQAERIGDPGFVPVDDDLLHEDEYNTGLAWRWRCLQQSVRRLRGGDFGIWAGRPDKGKTTTLADNIAYMGRQAWDMYQEELARWEEAGSTGDRPVLRPIIWLNNEGPGNRIMKRIVQAAFGVPTSKLIAMQKAGELWTAYEELMGSKEVIRVKDIHGWRAHKVEEFLRQHKPRLTVYDMIDKIRFDGAVGNGGTRTDQILEEMYDWGRNLGVELDMAGIATSQVSGDGDGVAYPSLAMLKDSKTGKQGACDFIVVIGAKNEPAYENYRYIGLTKNKLRIEGMPASPKAEVILDAECARVREPEEVEV